MPEPPKIFVSYSRSDKRWLDRLRLHLKPLEREGVVDLWADDRIKAGARWQEEIQQALAEAKAAILLISPHFLASDFIIEEELQPLLAKKAKEEGLHIFPLIVSDSFFLEMESLSQFQTVNDPAYPLDKMRPPARQTVFKELARAVRQALQPSPAQEERLPVQPSRQPKEGTDSPEKARKRKKTAPEPPVRIRAKKERPPPTSSTKPREAPPQTWQNALGMSFARIPAGWFQMGSEENDRERPVHRVTISRPFYLGTTVVTQGQWKAVMGTAPWKGKDYVQEGDDYPAVYVSWEDAQGFIERLKAQEGETIYRLPTEAEWEYACRSGSASRYSFGDDVGKLGDYAWYDENAWSIGERYARGVGLKAPNAWGFYDMHGNVWEWVADRYGAYPSEALTDPTGPEMGSRRVDRGGCFGITAGYARSASRFDFAPGDRNYYLGFRLLRTE